MLLSLHVYVFLHVVIGIDKNQIGPKSVIGENDDDNRS